MRHLPKEQISGLCGKKEPKVCWGGEIVQLIECLLSKYEDLSSIASIKDARNGGTCLQSQGFGDRNGRIPWACWLASLTKSICFRFNKRPCVKKKVGGQLRRHWCCLMVSTGTCIFAECIYTHIHILEHIHINAHTRTINWEFGSQGVYF